MLTRDDSSNPVLVRGDKYFSLHTFASGCGFLPCLSPNPLSIVFTRPLSKTTYKTNEYFYILNVSVMTK